MHVFKKMCTYEEAQQELANAGGVPPYIPEGSPLRVLKLVADDAGCPCGGTHVARTGEIGMVRIGKVEKKGKHNRRVNLHLD